MAAKALNMMCSLGGIITEQIKTLVLNGAVLRMTSSSALFCSSNAPMGPTQPHEQEATTKELGKESVAFRRLMARRETKRAKL